MVLTSKLIRYFAQASLVFVIIFLAGSPRLFAQSNSNIRAEICRDEKPVVDITSPVSDSVTDVPQITLTGSTIRTTQIDISLNNVYSHSVAIGNDGLLSSALTLVEGTNIISLDAYYSCNQETEEYEIVLTYEPRIVPSNGGDSITEVTSPGTIGPGVISSPGAASSETSPESLPERITDNLGITEDDNSEAGSFYSDYVIPIRSWFSLLAVVAVLPPYHLAWLFNAFGWKNTISKRFQLIFRFIAAVFAMLFALILQL